MHKLHTDSIKHCNGISGFATAKNIMPATQKDHCIDLHKTVVHSGLHALHSIISYHRLQWIPLHQSLAPWRILWFGRHKFSRHCKHLFAVYVCISQYYTEGCQKSVPKKARSSPKVGTPNPAYTILSQSFILSGFTLFCNASQPAFVELSTKVSLLSLRF